MEVLIMEMQVSPVKKPQIGHSSQAPLIQGSTNYLNSGSGEVEHTIYHTFQNKAMLVQFKAPSTRKIYSPTNTARIICTHIDGADDDQIIKVKAYIRPLMFSVANNSNALAFIDAHHNALYLTTMPQGNSEIEESELIKLHEQGVNHCKLSDNGRLLVASTNNQLIIYNVSTHTQLKALNISGGEVTHLALIRSGQQALIATSLGEIQLWNLRNHRLINKSIIGDNIKSLELSPNEKEYLVLTNSGEISLHSMGNLKELASLSTHQIAKAANANVQIRNVCSYHNGVATLHEDGKVRLWMRNSSQQLEYAGELNPQEEDDGRTLTNITSLALAPNRRSLLLGCENGEIHVCKVNNGFDQLQNDSLLFEAQHTE